MSDEMNKTVSVEHLLGSELAAAAGEALADARLRTVDPAVAVRLGIARSLLALYWDLRRERPEAPEVGDGMVAVVAERLGRNDALSQRFACAEARGMSSEINRAGAAEQLLGGDLAVAAEEEFFDAELGAFDPVSALRIATTQLLLALHWELRHQLPDRVEPVDTSLDVSLEWVSALLCST